MTEIVGLVGGGVMGSAAAPRIVAGGHALHAFDAAPAARERLARLGATPAADARAVAEQASIVLLFLPGPQQVKECVVGPGGVLSAARPGSVIVDMSTVDPGTTEEMSRAAVRQGVGYLDAPVLGRPSSVGNWALPIGGSAEDLDRCAPVLRLVAGKLFHIGGPGSGNKLKLLNQLMFSAINAMTAEMMAVADKVGVPPRLLYETITSSQAGTVSNLFKELGAKIAGDDYANPTFSVDLLCKDLRLAIAMAQEAGAPPLIAPTIQFANQMAQAQGLGQSDTAIMWKCFKHLWDGCDS